jgi:hypothetical protein
MSETAITKSILEWLNAQPECRAIKMHSGGAQGAGEPDIHGSWRGRSFFIEVKRPGEQATGLQLEILRRWQQAGALAFVASHKDHVKRAMLLLDSQIGSR